MYHNSGHHYNVGTKKDPATARRNEPVFLFWFRSHFGSYVQAWQIQTQILQKKNKRFISFQNKMLLHTISQIVLFSAILYIYGPTVLLYYVLAAHVGILLLETVNYIEHYGLQRKLKENGKLERVLPKHSWNSNHVIGRTLLFELSRHSDHHFKASKPYQILEHVPNSPQMITGYPGMMLLALIPPLWFHLMHKRIEAFEQQE
jgi:alkane 1-monooxygenase